MSTGLRSRINERVLVSAGLTLILAGFIVLTFDVPGVARYMPYIVAVPTLVLAAVATIADVADAGAPDGVGDGEGADDEVGEHALSKRAMWAWVLGLFAMFWLLGMLPTIIVYVVAYMVLVGRERITKAIAVAVATSFIVYLFFVQLLGAGVYRGYVLRDLVPAITGG